MYYLLIFNISSQAFLLDQNHFSATSYQFFKNSARIINENDYYLLSRGLIALTLKRGMRLTEMHIGQKGTVVKIIGGVSSLAKLEALGIRTGVKIEKKSALIARGPVIVSTGGTEIAMGYGMAQKIIVEVDAGEDIADRQS